MTTNSALVSGVRAGFLNAIHQVEINMNAKAPEQYLVFDGEDRFHASVCWGEDETREIIAQFDCPEGLQVLRITMGYPTRDVTDEFISSEDEDTAFGIPSPVDLRRWYNTQVL